jgi:hypothetical protein
VLQEVISQGSEIVEKYVKSLAKGSEDVARKLLGQVETRQIKKLIQVGTRP